MNGLDAASRDALERAILKARQILEEDLAEAAEGRLGIYADGAIDSEDALRLPPGELGERREVVEVVTHLRREGETADGAVGRLIREAAFTHLNRLVAIRVAEAIDLLPPSLAQGRISQGFRDVLEVAPLLAADATGGYWTYLRLCGDELAADDPVLFDPRNPLLALALSPAALDELVGILADPKLTAAWAAPDTFGWTYQFFNTGEERRQMRDESQAPRTSRELAVRNQFFTPRYVVDFLVQNSLGRRLLEADPDSGLVDKLPLLVDPPSTRGQPLALDEVRVLDPACGSGHFLLGCYDLLELAWQQVGVQPAEAAARILPCLWGIDIDPRCSQVASAALMLRARRACREGDLPRPNVLTARALPEDPEAWERALAGLSSTHGKLAASLRDALTQAPVLGPLLKVEERLDADLHRSVPEAGGEDTLFGAAGVAAAAMDRAEAEVLAAVQRVADEASSSAAERLLAAEATDAIRFVEAMRQRYDVVLMNPPFGEPVTETKPYLRAEYESIPSTADLSAAFVGRGLELLNSDGYLGAVTSRAGMFLTTFNRWREKVLLDHLVTLADLGFGVMEGANVEAAVHVSSARQRQPADESVFLRLLKSTDRPQTLAKVVAELRAGHRSSSVYSVRKDEFAKIPGSPLAYWAGPSIRRLFADLPMLEGSGAEVRRGSWPGDDSRYLRLWWEVDPRSIGRREAWVHYSKGGKYSPFYGEPDLVVAWDDERRTFRDFYGRKGRPSTKPENVSYYFRAGLTWPRRTTSGFGIRLLPAGCIFADKGPAVFSRPEEMLPLLAWLTSRLVRSAIDFMMAAGEETASGTASKSYEVGVVQRLPWVGPRLAPEVRQRLEELTRRLVAARARLDENDETTRRFVCPGALHVTGGTFAGKVWASWDDRETALARALDDALEVEQLLHDAIGLDNDGERFLDEEYGRHPASYPVDAPEDEVEFARLYTTPIDQVIDQVIETRGGSRTIATKSYFLDRRLEVLGHVLKRHPSALVHARRRLGVLPPEEPNQSTAALVSWLVGCAMGRWDVRVGCDPSIAPPPVAFDALPLCPPGMLVGDDGLPVREAPPGYRLELPPDRLLVDEPGHQWDIEAAVRRVAAVLLDDSEGFLAEVEGVLGHRSLRDYLRKQFFRDHLSRYSKSRRKAPIYWHLSVPSREWGVWVYAPALVREGLYAVASRAARRLAAGEERVAALRAERGVGGRGRSAREVGRHLEAEEELVKALQTFRAEAERVAGLGWEPDFDDGIVLCAAPLADLFPAWRQAAEERAKLREGAYPWASVSRWREAL